MRKRNYVAKSMRDKDSPSSYSRIIPSKKRKEHLRKRGKRLLSREMKHYE